MIGGAAFGSVGFAQVAPSATLALDRTANGFHGVYIGSPAPSRSGVFSGEYTPQFDGVDDAVIVADAAALDTTSALTLIARVLPTALAHANGGNSPRIISKGSWQWWVNNVGSMGFTPGASAPVSVSVASAIALNAWTPVGVTWDGAAAKFFKEGPQVGADQAITGGAANASPVVIGDFNNSSTERHWQGGLAHVALFNKAISPFRMATLTAPSFTPHHNLLQRSQEFDNSYWQKVRATVAANAITAPDGTLTADKLEEDSATGGHYLNRTTVETYPGGTVLTTSVYVQVAERTRFILYLLGAADTDYGYANFNLSTQSYTLSSMVGTASGYSARITDMGGGWYRCSVTGMPDAVTGTRRVRMQMLDGAGAGTYTGVVGNGMYFWGAQLEQGALSPYIPTTSAAVTINTYAEEVLLDGPVGYWPLTERLPAPVTEDAWALAPIRFAINSVLRADDIRMDALQIEGTLGQPMVCDFTLVNPSTKPRPGDRVLARYYDETLFSGLIDRIEQKPNQNMSVIDYLCTCTDWSILLTRRRLRRNFTNLPILNIVDSILDNELAGDGLSIGTIDVRTTIPLVDVRNARAFDVLRDMAGATGQAMYVDFNKAIQFRTSTNEPAPKVIDDTTVEASSLVEDMETYRNVQTVIVTGTAPQGTDANVVPVELTNDDQIAARQAIEGGTGRVEDIEEITHPTSNAGADLAILGLGYARLRLATSGTPRKTLRARVRGYGFREGQFASVNLTGVAVTGTWLIQRVTFRERTARSLVYDLELTQSSQQQRAYEAWLSIVQTGKVVVQMPGSITNNLEAFNAPGTTTWIVPVGVLQLTITAIGASGGGGGGALALAFFADEHQDAHGGDGGNGGRAVTTIDVAEGDEIGVTIGAAGIAGTGSTVFAGQTSGTAGTAATVTRVTRNGVTVCQADGGTGGGGGYANTDTALVTTHGADGIDGSGLGDAVTVGGGKNGGAGGTSGGNGAHGSDGSVSIAY